MHDIAEFSAQGLTGQNQAVNQVSWSSGSLTKKVHISKLFLVVCCKFLVACFFIVGKKNHLLWLPNCREPGPMLKWLICKGQTYTGWSLWSLFWLAQRYLGTLTVSETLLQLCHILLVKTESQVSFAYIQWEEIFTHRGHFCMSLLQPLSVVIYPGKIRKAKIEWHKWKSILHK